MVDKKAYFMGKALRQALVALKRGEVPVGVVVVDKEGGVIARAFNKIETVGCQSAHAEALAIQKACKKRRGWRLNGCWIYVTLEPCLMCIGLIQLSRIEGIVFGARSKLFGCGIGKVKGPTSYLRGLKVEGGIRAQESVALLRLFFQDVRRKKEKGSL